MKVVLHRRYTKCALKEAKVLTRLTYDAVLAFFVVYAGTSLLAPWPELPHVAAKIAPYWDYKLVFFLGLFIVTIGFYQWFIRHGWKIKHFIWWKWGVWFLVSVLPLLIALQCAFQGVQSSLLGFSLLGGWLIIYFYFFLRRFLRWDEFYKAMIEKGKINRSSGEVHPNIWNPSIKELDEGIYDRKINLAGGAAISFLAALGAILSGPLYKGFGTQAEIMNELWMGLHYLIACLLAPISSIMIFDVLLIYRWRRETGEMPFLGGLVRKPRTRS